MTQAERDRLVILKKAKKGLLAQAEAAAECGVSERQVRRMLARLKEDGDKSVIHGLKGKPSNRRLEEKIRERAEDAHRRLEPRHDLAAVLSHVEQRVVSPDYTVQFVGKRYAIERSELRAGLRGAFVRVEKRRDGSIAIRFGGHDLRHRECDAARTAVRAQPATPPARRNKARPPDKRSAWMRGFDLNNSPPIDEAIAISNATG